jgi:hypothetical protein
MTPEIVGQFLARVRRKIGGVNFLKSGNRNSESENSSAGDFSGQSRAWL